MRIVLASIKALVLVLCTAAVHYTLPSNDLVRIVGTEVVRMDIGEGAFFWSAGDAGLTSDGSRDIRFLNAVDVQDRPRVYRNEDTAFGWPPYFKFNSGNLQATVQNMVGEWAVVRHYGWRSTLLSIYPNALSIRLVSTPGDQPTNWIRIAGFLVFGLVVLGVWRLGYLLRLWLFEKVQILLHRMGLKR